MELNDRALPIALVACAIFLALAGPGLPQGNPVADFSIELVEDIPSRTPLGSEGTFKFVVTNNSTSGPPIAFAADASPIPFVSGQKEALAFFRSDSTGNDCYIQWAVPEPLPGLPLSILYSTYLSPLGPGETFVCELEMGFLDQTATAAITTKIASLLDS